ncbi:hypothetical protein TNCV_4829201 [Trichonephila clavipes]|nr:hypothetical protein TNCV_4829201 [Trichonephila clavipes]
MDNNREMASDCPPVARSIFVAPTLDGNRVGTVPVKRRRTYGDRFVPLFSGAGNAIRFMSDRTFCLFL